MRITLVLLVGFALACASAPRPKGPSVDVYEADMASPPAARRLPDGCRILAASGPVDQMESERAMDDPYKRQRSETLQKGGNVLLVLSERTVTRPNLDCPSGDTSADCVRQGQSWYRVKFEEYACAPEAAGELADRPSEPRRGGISIPLASAKPAASPSLTPREMKERLLEMARAGVAPDVLLAYVRGQRLSRKMTAEDIIDWTKALLPDSVIEAAASR
ncbi:MAG TPA: hypothetical protein VFZ57_10415 [Thermoanaerobaculia bacterium]|nr:hypothetical protein [Thermoanaerobaculia bacterium]